MNETKRGQSGADHVQNNETPKQPKFSAGDWQFLMNTTIAVTVLTVILLLLLF